MKISQIRKKRNLKLSIRKASSVRELIQQKLEHDLENNIFPQEIYVEMFNYYTLRIHSLENELMQIKKG